MADAPRKDDVTRLLEELSDGNQDALAALVPLVYEQLRRLARSHMRRERHVQTLQTTALVHEAYMRLVDQRNVRWQNRAHFFAIAAQAMRRILVSRARARLAEKRGGGAEKVPIDDLDIANPESSVDLVAMVALVTAAGKPAALSNTTPLVTATQEAWTATSTPDTFSSPTAAHQFVRYHTGVAQASADTSAPLNMAGV